jgi:hypothetical protein
MGEAISGDCKSGAAGAVVGEFGAEWTGSSDAGKIFSAFAGLAVGDGGDDVDSVNAAYAAGSNAIDNNYNLNTGEVEEGDTLEEITDEINKIFGTNLTAEELAEINNIDNEDLINVGDIVKVGTITKDGKTWTMFYANPDRVNRAFLDSLPEDQVKIVHNGRIIFAHDNLPVNTVELQTEIDSWDKKSGDAVAHNIGTTGNVDYRGEGARSNQQAIYDADGNIVTTPENGGSYDYQVPGGAADILFNSSEQIDEHLFVDVLPWIEYGNSPQDTTTKLQREQAMASTYLGRKGLKTLGYSDEQIERLQNAQ